MCRARGSWQGIFWVLLQTKRLHDQLFAWQMDRLQELTVFVRAAESGSFSRAARTRTFAAIGLTHHWRARAATRRDLFTRHAAHHGDGCAQPKSSPAGSCGYCLITRWSRWRFTPSFQVARILRPRYGLSSTIWRPRLKALGARHKERPDHPNRRFVEKGARRLRHQRDSGRASPVGHANTLRGSGGKVSATATALSATPKEPI
jgi:hypothetical protein